MDKDDVRSFAATFMTDATSPPTPRPRRLLLRGRFDLVQIADVIVALICFAGAPSSGSGAAARASSPSRSSATRASARCSRSVSASRGSCTTWSPTTCR